MTITLNAFQKQRRDTASNWTSNNPTLLAGEFGWETDTKKIKIGDGSTAWQSLDYLPIPDTNRLLTGNLTVGGNFTVNGTTTTIDTTTLTVEDKNIEIGKVSTPSDTTADGGGITLKGATDKTINWVDSTDSWTLSEHLDFASGKVVKVAGTQILSATQYTGNSATTTALATARTIGGTSFDGTANIAIALAASATALETARTIAGVSFNGTANISLNNNAITNGAGYITGSALNASNLSSGTIPDARFPATLPAISGANLTSLPADATKLPLAGGTLTGDLLLDNQKDLRFVEADANGSNYVAFQAPAAITSDITWTLPATDAAVSGYALVSDGSGTLSWAAAGGGAKGGSGEAIFHESEVAMDNDYTISTNHNAVVPSPLTINATLTIPSGSVVTFV